MSSPTLKNALAKYGSDAYLLTVGKAGPHTSHVSVHLIGNVIECAIGASAARNIASEPNVSIFWPPNESGGYAMIVNGVARGSRDAAGASIASIELTKSVFHRPGPKPTSSEGSCASDCERIVRPA